MKELRKILVPVDFSSSSTNALSYGLELAKRFNSELIIIHAIHYSGTFPDPQAGMDVRKIEEVEQEANSKMDEYVSNIPELKQQNFRKLIVSGFATDVVADFIEEDRPDLVIMGTKGAAKVNQYFLGSTTSSVVHRVDIPVLIVPEYAKFKDLKNVLFLFDMEGMKDFGKLDLLKFFSRTYQSFIHILYVKGKYPTKDFSGLAVLESYFDTVKHAISSSLFEHFRAGVNDFIQENNINMIAILVRERNFFERLFHISHTDQLAFHSELPILAIPE